LDFFSPVCSDSAYTDLALHKSFTYLKWLIPKPVWLFLLIFEEMQSIAWFFYQELKHSVSSVIFSTLSGTTDFYIV